MVLKSNWLPLRNSQKSGDEMVTNAEASAPCGDCPVSATLALIGGRWKPLILFQLTSGTRRFGQLAVRIPGLSRKVLTEQLRELEKNGLITRQEFREIPPRVEYSLTERAMALSGVFSEMAKWGRTYLGVGSAAPQQQI